MSVKVAVLGYGVVGSGVVELFYKNKKSIEQHAGCEMDIKYIVDIRDFADSPYKDKFTKDFNDVLNDPEISVVAECMGGIEPAFSFLKAALEKGKSAATSNKELVAAKGDILLALAKANNCNFFFEASVGGAIPIIRPLHRCLAANDITKAAGILNGTTNFILTKMYTEGMDFDEALKMAQELGYAEKDPTADVEGHDACRKICILSSLIFGKHVYPESVYTKGISAVDLCDVEASDLLGHSVKLVASVRRLADNRILPAVMPMLVPHENIMSGVSDVFNAVLVYGDGIDQTMFYGRGAGKLPTASAVLGDVIEAAKHKVNVFSQTWESVSDNSFVAPVAELSAKWYFRVSGEDKVFGDPENVYRDEENGISFITRSELTFAEAEEKAKEISALAVMPVFE